MTPHQIDATPVWLLERLHLRDDQDAWRRFVCRYSPLFHYWARKLGFSSEDAADRVQDMFLLLARKMPSYQYDEHKRFLGWLWTVFVNSCRQARRRHDALEGAIHTEMDHLACADNIPEVIEQDESRHLAESCLKLVETEFPATVYQVFWQYVGLGKPPEEVAADVGISVDQVYQAKCRVLHRLRQVFASGTAAAER